ncbi:glutamine--tRNA ligase/YqeY domain fusion protein [Myxococcota bacterium]|nr:glutamine--tRNA ligase/YqeY domain fusion protein [Myxococcota bacterium]
MSTAETKSNFIRQIIDADLESGRHTRVVTRFPPEPNGYLHIGHAKSICLNFGLARDYGGTCHLRMDDTNPETEEEEYIEAIKNDVSWLGFEWGEKLFHASDFFEQMYQLAVGLIRDGKAYVDHLTPEEISEYRGTVREPARPSPYRDRSVDENLDLFTRMRAGEFPDGHCVLRAKGDLASPNMKLRDPLLYRIRKASHPRTGDTWCIYPMYDYAHPLEDAFEHITHSICTLEFENNRDIYDWVLDNTPVPARPHQYEFARLNVGYTVLSKRKLLQLVNEKHVAGWDDPRMPTIAGMRRRGFTPEAIRNFCDLIGVAKANSFVDIGKLEFCLREDLNLRSPRYMAVLDPIEVELVGWAADRVTMIDAPLWPEDVGRPGTRPLPLGGRVFIEREDFEQTPPKGFKRLSPGAAVRLRYGPVIRCDEVLRDETGRVVKLRCAVFEGDAAEAPRVEGTIHWVPAHAAVPAEVRLYDRLFSVEKPDADTSGRDWLTLLNPENLVVVRGALVEPALAALGPGQHVQLERTGYFYTDPKDTRPGAPVFNRVVTLRDSWAKRATVAASPAPSVVRPAATAAADTGKAARKSRTTLRAEARAAEPALAARYDRYLALGLSAEDADVLTGAQDVGDLFEAALSVYGNATSIARWVVNEVLGAAKDAPLSTLALDAAGLAGLVRMVDAGDISNLAGKEVLAELVEKGGTAVEIVERRGLRQVNDAAALGALVEAVIAAHPDHVARYKAGNAGLLGFLTGAAVRQSGGKANPQQVRALLEAALAG